MACNILGFLKLRTDGSSPSGRTIENIATAEFRSLLSLDVLYFSRLVVIISIDIHLMGIFRK